MRIFGTRSTRIVCLLAFPLLLTLLTTPQYTDAASPEGRPQAGLSSLQPVWGVPTKIFDNQATTTGSLNVVQDGAGNLHVLWYWFNNSSSGAGLLYAKRTAGGTWLPTEVVPTATVDNQPETPQSPVLLVDDNGTVHVLWLSVRNTGRYAAYTNRDANGQWAQPTTLPLSLGVDFKILARLGPDGTVHVAGKGLQSYLTLPPGGVWSSENLPCGSIEFEVSDQGTTHMICYGGRNSYTKRVPGQAWTTPVEVSDGADDQFPQLAVDGVGDVHFIWSRPVTYSCFPTTCTRWDLYYRAMIGGVLTEPTVVSDQFFDSMYTMQVEAGADGTAHLMWTKLDSTGNLIDTAYRRRLPDGTWSQIDTRRGDLAKMVVAEDGDVHLIWRGSSQGFQAFEHQWRSSTSGWSAVDYPVTAPDSGIISSQNWANGYAVAAGHPGAPDGPHSFYLVFPPPGRIYFNSFASSNATPVPGTLQLSSAAYSAGEGAAKATITVTRAGGSDGAVSVNYATSNGTATAGQDYAAASGTLNFADGETSRTFDVSITQDALFEGDETVNLSLSAAAGGATLGSPSTAVLTIVDDDNPPSFSINDVTVSEGDSGMTAAAFTVKLSSASGLTASVNYITADGTATQPGDYVQADGTLTFNPGETSKTVSVTINGDTTFEPDETFFVNLSGASNATLADAQGRGTITNDEAGSTFQFSSAAYSVGEAGPNATITVTRTGSSAGGATVNYSTSDGTATAGSDYAAASGTLTFASGETSKSFNVPVTQDTLFEGGETVNLSLSAPFGGVLGAQAAATLTINDDDSRPTLQFSSATFSAAEGAGAATVTVTRTGGTNDGVTVSYATSNGTATGGSDYTATSGALSFAAGETSKTFTVIINDDSLDEADETINLSLSGPGGVGVLGAQSTATLTISDDDAAPSLSIGDATMTEGGSGTVSATFAVTLSAASGRAVTVNYATADGTASAPGDYAQTSGTLTFAPGETSKSVTVNVKGDTSDEPDETFFVNLSGAANATVADAQGLGTILNDDTPRLAFAQDSFPASESAHFVTVTVTRSGDSSPAVAVDFATSDGTATERRDYTAVSGRLQFAPGETSKTFDVLLTEDAYTEPEETINLTLSNPDAWAALGSRSAAKANISADDNPAPGANPIDDSSNFVRQHYHDFLNREPDAEGLNFWTNEIEQCGADLGCREVKRINVSAAFFLSIEFQETGYFVYRLNKVAFGNAAGIPVPVRFRQFFADTRQIGRGVVVGQGDWENVLRSNRQFFTSRLVQSTEFRSKYPATMTPAQFVDALNENAGGVLDSAERAMLISQLTAFGNDSVTRADVLRKVVEDEDLIRQELNKAFVLMQYYGYLRRNPDDAPDADFSGWQFWLDKLNQFNGNFVQAEMVKAFLSADEYRKRFGQ